MRSVFLSIFTLLLLVPFVANAAASLTIDLAKTHVDITTGFNGAPLYIHGYIKTDDEGLEPYDVVVVIKGPSRDTVVRRKEKFLGMWMNRLSVTFEDVYSFYDLAGTDLLHRIASPEILKQHAIGLDYLSFQTEEADLDEAAQRTFQEALIQTKQSSALYALAPRDITFISGLFFRTTFSVPPSVPTGEYSIDAYLFKDGEIVDRQSEKLSIKQVGMNAEIFQFARDNAFLYGLTAILLALVFGWSAHAFLRQD